VNALVTVPQNNAEIYRASTDAAALCKDIVVATAMEIQDRKYVRVEGWQAIAIAHGCTASARDVERIEGGVRAIGEVRRMSDGAVIAEAEGFVGEDEPTWYGGTVEKDEWTGPKGKRRKTGNKITTVLPKRSDYAIRAMAQTRAISRACRSAFAHVVVMMNAGLQTTPAEEVPEGGFHDAEYTVRSEPAAPDFSGAVATAKVTIDMCESVAAADAWRVNNQAVLDQLAAQDPDAFDDVCRYWKARVKELKARTPPAAKAAFPGDFGDVDAVANILGEAA
jgi:hypothetical protein